MSGRAEGWTATTGQGASEAEIRAGQRLWDAVSDPEWRATDENLVFMSRAPFSVPACVEVLQAALGTGPGAGARWSWGTEALVAACTDRADELARAATRADDGLGVAVRWALARRARSTGEPLGGAALRIAAAWFVAPLPDPDPRQPDAWWPGWEQVWDPAAWWAAVVEALTDLRRPVATSPRLRRAWHHADDLQRATLLCRLFPGGPRWAQQKSAELERAAWDPLMDVAEAIQKGDLTASGPAADSLRAIAPGAAVVLTSLSARLDRDLEPGFHAAVLRAAVEHNRSLDAIEPINEALRRLPEEHRQRIMLEAPYLRWRHLPAVPTQTVIDWAVGEVAALSARSFQTMERSHPEGAFHFGHTPDELKLIAAEALGASGEAAVPFLIDGLSRAPDANKVVFATALAVQRSGEAIPVLVHALAHGSTAVREVVQEGLAAFGDALLPELEPLLKDDRRAVRSAAALVLSRMEASGDVRQLASHALLDEDGPEIRATLAAVADAPVRPPELVDVEAREAAVPRGYRRALGESLRLTEGRAWRDHLDLGIVALGLVADWYADQRGAGRDDAAELFLDAVGLFASDPGTPWVLARVVDHPRFEPAWLSDAADLVGPDLVKPLAWRSRSGPPERRRAMLKALVALHPAGGVRELIRSMTSTDAEVRRTCQEGLRAAGDAAVPALREALQSEDSLVRQQAALALERLPDPANAPALRGALASEADTLTAWVLQRALAVSAIESGPQQDRALDRMLAQQRGHPLGSYVVDMALPTLTWRSGVPFSTEARSWLLNGMVSIAERVDWFLPISHTARLVWAIRRRMDDRSTLVLLDDLRRQARGLDPHDTAPLLAVATALLAPESEIEGLAARIADPAWGGPSVGGRRMVFPDGDPRVLFLRGSAGSLRATLDLAAWSGNSLVLAWAREAVRRLREALSVTQTELDAAVRPPKGWTVGQARQELARRMRTGEALPLVRWLQELRDPTLGRVASSLVFDSLDREGRVRDRFRWRLGLAQDASGEPVVVGDSVRVSDPLDWHPDEKEAWRGVLREGSQPISQCHSSPNDSETDHEVLDTGWLPTPVLAMRLQAAGYHWLGIEEATPGGREVFPPSPAMRAMRPLEDGWAARLDTTILRSLSADHPDPPVARVVRWSALSPARTGGWRERPRGELPWMLRRQVYGELAWLDRDSDRESATEFMPVLASQAERAAPADAPKPEPASPETALAPRGAAEAPRRAAKAAPPPDDDAPKGFFAWLFRDRKKEREKAERERELAEAKARREEARRRADEARRRVESATVAEVQRKREEQRQRSERWGSVEEALVEARAARATRLKVEAEERRAAHRSAAEREAGGLLLRRLVRDLEAVGGAPEARAAEARPQESRPSEARKPALREVKEGEELAVSVASPVDVASAEVEVPVTSTVGPAAPVEAAPVVDVEAPEPADEAHAAVARWLAERARRAAGARQQARQRLQAQRSGGEGDPQPAEATAPEAAPRAAAADTVRQWQEEREAKEAERQQAAAQLEEAAEARRREAEARAADDLARRQAAQRTEAEARRQAEAQRAADERAREAELAAANVAVATIMEEPDAGGFLDLLDDEPAPSVAVVAATAVAEAAPSVTGLAVPSVPLAIAGGAAPTLMPPDDDDDDWFVPAKAEPEDVAGGVSVDEPGADASAEDPAPGLSSASDAAPADGRPAVDAPASTTDLFLDLDEPGVAPATSDVPGSGSRDEAPASLGDASDGALRPPAEPDDLGGDEPTSEAESTLSVERFAAEVDLARTSNEAAAAVTPLVSDEALSDAESTLSLSALDGAESAVTSLVSDEALSDAESTLSLSALDGAESAVTPLVSDEALSDAESTLSLSALGDEHPGDLAAAEPDSELEAFLDLGSDDQPPATSPAPADVEASGATLASIAPSEVDPSVSESSERTDANLSAEAPVDELAHTAELGSTDAGLRADTGGTTLDDELPGGSDSWALGGDGELSSLWEDDRDATEDARDLGAGDVTPSVEGPPRPPEPASPEAWIDSSFADADEGPTAALSASEGSVEPDEGWPEQDLATEAVPVSVSADFGFLDLFDDPPDAPPTVASPPTLWADDLMDDLPTEAAPFEASDEPAVLEPLDSRFNDGLALPVGALLDLDDTRPSDLMDPEDDSATVTPPDRDDPTESWNDEATEAWVEEDTAHVEGVQAERTRTWEEPTSALEASLDAETAALLTLSELTSVTDEVDVLSIAASDAPSAAAEPAPAVPDAPPVPAPVAAQPSSRRSAREVRVSVSRALAAEARASESMELEAALVDSESELAGAAFARWRTNRLAERARQASRERAVALGELVEEPYESTADVGVWQREAVAFAGMPTEASAGSLARAVVVEEDEGADLPWLEEEQVSRSLADGFVDDDIITDLLNVRDAVDEATLRFPRVEADPLEERTESFHRLPEGSWTVFDPDDSDATDGQATQVIRAVDLREPDEERTASIRGDHSWSAEYTVPVIEPDWPHETTATDVERYVPVVEIQDGAVGDAEIDTVSPELVAALRRGEIAKPAEGVGGLFKRLWKRIGG